MTVFEHATLQELHESSAFDALSPVKPGPEQPFRSPVIRDEHLGILTSWVNNTGDRSIVFRSWGLMDEGNYYGKDFTWKEYQRVSNWVSAIIWFIIMKVIVIVPLFAPLRSVYPGIFLRSLLTVLGGSPGNCSTPERDKDPLMRPVVVTV
jgi:hypothetical protein